MIENQVEQCPICLEDMQEQLVYFGCHTFHQQCLKQHAKAKLDGGVFPIKCPEQSCTLSLDFQSIRHLESSELSEQFLDFSIKDYLLKNNKALIHCPTPNCTYTVEYQMMCKRPLGANKVFGKKCTECGKYFCKCVREIVCELCSKVICVLCKESHVGLTCYQYQFNRKIDVNFNAFVKYIKEAKFKKCPECNYWVEKSAGCDHMTCRCGKQFCYKCNGEYLKCPCMKGRRPDVDLIYPKEVRPYMPVSPMKTDKKKKQAPKNKMAIKPTIFQFGFGFDLDIIHNRSSVV